GADKMNVACRVYAPVGSHEDLLPYLVRRLLENGANTSFLHHVLDDSVPIEQLVADPVEKLERRERKPNPRIPPPPRLYADRKNSLGINAYDVEELIPLAGAMARAIERPPNATPIVGGRRLKGAARQILDPSD